MNNTEIDFMDLILQKSGGADCFYSPTKLETWQWSEHRRSSRRQSKLESKTFRYY